MTWNLSQWLSAPLLLLPNSQILCGYSRIYRDSKYFRGLLNILASLVCSEHLICCPSIIFYGLKDHV